MIIKLNIKHARGKQLVFISLKLNQKIEPYIWEDGENDVEYYHYEEIKNSQLP